MSDNTTSYGLWPIGQVDSPLADVADSTAQGDEGAPDAWVVLRPELRPAMRNLVVGDVVIVLTWLNRADRDVLEVHARSDPARSLTGIFSTRSPDRPNPIGLHEVRIFDIDDT